MNACAKTIARRHWSNSFGMRLPIVPMPNPDNLGSILAALGTAEVEFVLVGALAAVAQGAPVTTH